MILNRPETINSLTAQMMEELLVYFQALSNQGMERTRSADQPRVVILKGAGPKGFCAGLDITDPQGNLEAFGTNMEDAYRTQRRISDIVIRMRRIPQPIIGLFHGPTCGGGLALMLACDVRLCQEGFRANVAMASIGLSGSDIGISYLLPRIVGWSMASEMTLTAKFINAQRALQCGLVSAVYPTMPELESAGAQMAKEMLSLGVMGLELSKQGLNASMQASSLDTQVMLEDRQQIMVSYEGEFTKRIAAFRAKSNKNKSKL